MAKIRNLTAERRFYPWAGYGGQWVDPDEVVEIPDDTFNAYTWDPDGDLYGVEDAPAGWPPPKDPDTKQPPTRRRGKAKE